jgi:hypothetical protein
VANYRKIYALLKSIGKTNEWLHEMLVEWTGKSHLRELTQDEYNTVVKALENAKNTRPYEYGDRTEKQLRLILFYKQKLRMKTESLNAFILRTTGDKHNTDELKIADASAVINGLMKLKIRK